jgi:hypothetical protein
MPDSVLLFANTDASLRLISPAHSESLNIPPSTANRPLAVASLALGDGDVSWGFPVANDPSKRWKVRCAVGLYSTSDQKWRTYGDFSQVHATAISAAGSKVAFLADEGNGDTRRLFLLDVGNGQTNKVAKTIAVTGGWSPDRRELVLGNPGGDTAPQIKIFDINSHRLRELVEGKWPSWSPSGDWIAYFDHSNEGVHLVRPDGTGNRILKNVIVINRHKNRASGQTVEPTSEHSHYFELDSTCPKELAAGILRIESASAHERKTHQLCVPPALTNTRSPGSTSVSNRGRDAGGATSSSSSGLWLVAGRKHDKFYGAPRGNLYMHGLRGHPNCGSRDGENHRLALVYLLGATVLI